MLDWLDRIAGPDYAPAILWTAVALVLLLVILVIIRLIRSMTFGTFVAGGRNRKTRLAVMDATAIDSHRRLVLVRRDDIEHLLLIGGPTDVVVERDIRLVAARRPPAAPADSLPPASGQQRTVQQATPAQLALQRQQVTPAKQAPAQAQKQLQQRTPAAAQQQAPYGAQPVIRQAAPAARPVQSLPQPVKADPVDEDLFQDFEVSLDDEEPATPSKPAAKAAQPSLDDEMTRLLGELSNHKK
jgi:hypothetical protein